MINQVLVWVVLELIVLGFHSKSSIRENHPTHLHNQDFQQHGVPCVQLATPWRPLQLCTRVCPIVGFTPVVSGRSDQDSFQSEPPPYLESTSKLAPVQRFVPKFNQHKVNSIHGSGPCFLLPYSSIGSQDHQLKGSLFLITPNRLMRPSTQRLPNTKFNSNGYSTNVIQ